MTFYIIPSDSDLMHYGIKGQKWGVRRFQNPDGSLTNLGKSRYNSSLEIKAPKKFTVESRYEAQERRLERKARKKEFKGKEPEKVNKKLDKLEALATKYYALDSVGQDLINTGYRWFNAIPLFGIPLSGVYANNKLNKVSRMYEELNARKED